MRRETAAGLMTLATVAVFVIWRALRRSAPRTTLPPTSTPIVVPGGYPFLLGRAQERRGDDEQPEEADKGRGSYGP